MKTPNRFLPWLICLSLFTLFHCAHKGERPGDQFLGHWESAAGDYVTIFPEGFGDLKKGLVSMHGADVHIESNHIQCALWGKEEILEIEQEPEDHETYWAMTLSGVEYKKEK